MTTPVYQEIPSGHPALQAVNLVKDFKGFRATNNVTLTINEGEIHAIIGPNDAGKTTLFNLLSGFLKPSGGSVSLFGERIDTLPPFQIVRRGLTLECPPETGR